jgi:hypothetical protein
MKLTKQLTGVGSMKINGYYHKSRLSWDRRFFFELGKWIARLKSGMESCP